MTKGLNYRNYQQRELCPTQNETSPKTLSKKGLNQSDFALKS